MAPSTSTRGRSLGRWLLAGLTGLAAVAVMAAVAAAIWLGGTTAGLEWFVARLGAERVTVQGLHGTLWGPLGAERVALTLGDRQLVIDELAVEWRPWSLWRPRLDIVRLSARRVEERSPRSDEPTLRPDTLELPLRISVEQLRIDELRLLTAEDGAVRFAARDIRARGDSDGRRHRLAALQATHELGRLTANGELIGEPPFALRAQAQFAGSADAGDAKIEATVTGTLAELVVEASGRGRGLSGTADARLHPFAPFPLAGLRLALNEFDVRIFAPQAPAARLALHADLQAQPDGRLSGPLTVQNAAPTPLDRGGVPVMAAAAIVTVVGTNELAADDLDLTLAGGGRIRGQATWQRDTASGTADLRIERLDLAALDTRLRRTRLAGSALLSGGIDAQRGRLTLADEAVRVEAVLARAGDEITLNSLQARLGRNRLDAKGRLGGRGNELELVLAAPELRALGPGFGGALTATARLTGSVERPQGSFSARGRQLVWSVHRLASIDASGELRGETMKLAVNASDYTAGDEAEPRFRRLAATLDGRRSRHDLRLELALANARRVAFSAQGALTGTAGQWREARWQGSVTALEAELPLPLKLLAPAAVTLHRQRIEVAATSFAAGGGRVEHGLSVWTPQRWQSRGRFTGVGLRLVNGALPAGGESLRLGGLWDVSAVGVQLDGRLEIAREAGDWVLAGDTPQALGIRELQLSVQARGNRIDGRLQATSAYAGTWRGEVGLSLPASRSDFAVSPQTALNGRVSVDSGDIAWLGAVLGSGYNSGGRLDADVTMAGTLGEPVFSGQLRGKALTLALLDQGVRLERGELVADFDASQLRIERLHFSAPHAPPPRVPSLARLPFALGAGTLEASGAIDLRSRRGKLDFSARHLPLSQRADRWIVGSGRGSVVFDTEHVAVDANVVADAGFVAEPPADRPRLSSDVVIAGREATPAGPRVDLVVEVDVGEHFRIRAAGLDARLVGRVRVRGDSGQPLQASGSIATVDATFDAYGQRLTVERGIVNFQGAVDDPGLNVLALRKGLAVEAGVEVTGTVRRPKVRLVSVPPVPDPEKLSWIVLGRGPETAGADSALLLAAAGALLGGQSGAPTAQLAQAFGVDELGLRSATPGSRLGMTSGTPTGSAAGSDTLTGQILTVGKRLSARATLGYEQGLSAAAGVVKLTYQLTPRISVVGRTGADNAIDVYYTFSFD